MLDMSTQTDFRFKPADTLSNRLVLVRKELGGISQREAADRCQIPFGVWQGMEKGRETRRVDVQVTKIAMALNVDRDWLMWGGALAEDGPSGPDDGSTTDGEVLLSKPGNVTPLRRLTATSSTPVAA